MMTNSIRRVILIDPATGRVVYDSDVSGGERERPDDWRAIQQRWSAYVDLMLARQRLTGGGKVIDDERYTRAGAGC